MNTQQDTFQRIINERQPLLRTVFNFFIGYNTFGVLSSLVSMFFLDSTVNLIITTLLNVAIIVVLIWARQALGTPALKMRLQIFFGLALLLAATAALATHTLVYMFPASVLISVILFSIMGYFTSGKWFGYIGAALFFVVGLLEASGALESIHTSNSSSAISTIIVITLLMAATIAMISVYNDILVRTISVATQRQQEAEAVKEEMDTSLTQVKAQAAEQERLLALIQDLETPAIPVLPGVLVLPIVGHLDSHRIVRLNDSLLERVSLERASTVLLDLTGVGLVDTATANHLIQMVRSVRLLGARCILTGVRSEVAQTMVTLGIDWGNIPTSASLQNAIQAILEERMQRI